MEENKIESIDFIPEKKEGTEKVKKTFKAKCFKCKEKEKMTDDKGIEFELPFKYVEVPKKRDLMKECKEYVKESKEKYKNERVIKRALYHYCPNCGSNINICCKDYVDFYSNKKSNKNKENSK
jgi:hypothetical protein